MMEHLTETAFYTGLFLGLVLGASLVFLLVHWLEGKGHV